jgi:CHAD domain-containing protein
VAMGAGLVVARAERDRRSARRHAKRQARRRRRFGLLVEETPAKGLQRIALAQLDLAIELLREEADTAEEEAIHETRKAFKRLRALMRLSEDQIGADAARRERKILRDAGRRLAGARDAEVMVATLEDVLRREPPKLARRRSVVELREHLQRERTLAAQRMREDAGARESVLQELLAMRLRVQLWRLPEHPALELTGPGLGHIYRSGRRSRRRVRTHTGEHRDRTMHRWRKHTKELRYALEALDVEDGKRGDRQHKRKHKHKHIRKLAARADALGELLGEDHDLVVLAAHIRAYEPLRRRRRTRKRLLRAISRRRAKLRKRTMRRGSQLYEHKPAKFVRGLRPS